MRDLRRLRVVGIVAPAVFLVLCEAVRTAILDPVFDTGLVSLVIGGLVTIAAIVFGWLIFVHIDRAESEIVRRNRDLATVTAASLAIRDEIDPDRVMRGALQALADATGAVEAQAVVYPGTSGSPEREISIHRPEAQLSDALGGHDRTVEIPLSAGAEKVGHLRLRVSASRANELPSPEALAMVAQHLTAAIQIGQLIEDLHRRRDEGHTFYETLLRISNRLPLAEVLDTVVSGAQARLAADEGWVCLTQPVLRDLAASLDLEGSDDGRSECEESEARTRGDTVSRRHRCAIERATDFASTLEVPIWSSDEHVGDLWVGRRTGASFTERDRGYLVTLAGLTAIAVTAARAREHEAQAAILAERDRIARELHDSLAQVLGSTHLRLRAQLARPEIADRPTVIAELEELAEITEDAYHDVREAILGLRESSRPRGFLEGLRAYLEKFGVQSGVKTVLETTIPGEPDLAAKAEIQIIRVIQEALTNVRKHARATTASVRVSTSPLRDMLTIVVEDDGRGFEPGDAVIQRDGGYGLQTMRERMELAGGSVRVDSAPGRGTRIIAIVPAASNPVGSATLPDHR